VVFYVEGPDKWGALQRLLDPAEGGDRTPAKLIIPEGDVTVFADHSATGEETDAVTISPKNGGGGTAGGRGGGFQRRKIRTPRAKRLSVNIASELNSIMSGGRGLGGRGLGGGRGRGGRRQPSVFNSYGQQPDAGESLHELE